MTWTVKNWFVQDFKGHGHDADEWRDYDEDSVPFERLEKVYVPDELFRTKNEHFPWPALHPLQPGWEVIANFVFLFSSFFDKELRSDS